MLTFIMAKEIERKFLVADNSYESMATSCRHIMQGYLCRRPESTVRVRIADGEAWLTVKSRNRGIERDEWEYPIPVEDARLMLSRCADGNVIEKYRYIVPFGGFTWEVDRFCGAHEGLIVAEVELPHAAVSPSLPPFLGKEVSGDPQYYNSNL